jgi:hypothetical protein
MHPTPALNTRQDLLKLSVQKLNVEMVQKEQDCLLWEGRLHQHECNLDNDHIWELHRARKIEGNLKRNRTDIMSSPWETHGVTPARNPRRLAGYVSTTSLEGQTAQKKQAYLHQGWMTTIMMILWSCVCCTQDSECGTALDVY